MLIDCLECGSKISDRASRCPKCGGGVRIPIGKIKCEECGKQYEHDSTECDGCGCPTNANKPQGVLLEKLKVGALAAKEKSKVKAASFLERFDKALDNSDDLTVERGDYSKKSDSEKKFISYSWVLVVGIVTSFIIFSNATAFFQYELSWAWGYLLYALILGIGFGAVTHYFYTISHKHQTVLLVGLLVVYLSVATYMIMGTNVAIDFIYYEYADGFIFLSEVAESFFNQEPKEGDIWATAILGQFSLALLVYWMIALLLTAKIVLNNIYLFIKKLL